jgi:hypothetical protein
MESMSAMWRKSSYSGSGGGECTEVATVPGAVLVRDSKNPDGPRLAFGREAWEAFASAIKSRLQRNNPGQSRLLKRLTGLPAFPAGEGSDLPPATPRAENQAP